MPTPCWCTTAISGKAMTPASPARAARVLPLLMAHELNLFAYHLPLDAHVEFGNNAQLGKRLGLVETGPLRRAGDRDGAAFSRCRCGWTRSRCRSGRAWAGNRW